MEEKNKVASRVPPIVPDSEEEIYPVDVGKGKTSQLDRLPPREEEKDEEGKSTGEPAAEEVSEEGSLPWCFVLGGTKRGLYAFWLQYRSVEGQQKLDCSEQMVSNPTSSATRPLQSQLQEHPPAPHNKSLQLHPWSCLLLKSLPGAIP